MKVSEPPKQKEEEEAKKEAPKSSVEVKEEEKKEEQCVSHQSSILSFVSESIASTPSSKGKEDPQNKASNEKAKDSKQMD